MNIRLASDEDLVILSKLNFQLIQDEGHRNPMGLNELQTRMGKWLVNDYSACLFELDTQVTGYVLWKKDSDFIYIRQFFIVEAFRNKGFGKQAFYAVKSQFWEGFKLRLDVLINNERGVKFWSSVGFNEYCITMECSND